MRRIAVAVMMLFSFAVPWEYSLDLGEPFGNIARLLGLLLLVVCVPLVLRQGAIRKPGPVQWAVLALYLYFVCSYFWTASPVMTLEKMRAYFQVMMIVWLVWEVAKTPGHLRWLMRAFVAGCWVLAILTVLNYASAEAVATE